MRGKQSVKKDVWYIGGRKRYRKRTKRGQRGRGLPIGLIASAAAPFLGEITKPIFKKILVVEGKDDDEAKRTVTSMCYTTKGLITKQCIVPSKV